MIFLQYSKSAKQMLKKGKVQTLKYAQHAEFLLENKVPNP